MPRPGRSGPVGGRLIFNTEKQEGLWRAQSLLNRVQFQTEGSIGLAVQGPLSRPPSTPNRAEQRYPKRTGFPTARNLSVVLLVKVFGSNEQTRTTPVSYRIHTPLPVRTGKAAEKNFNTEDMENHGGPRRGLCRLAIPRVRGLSILPDRAFAQVVGAGITRAASRQDPRFQIGRGLGFSCTNV